MAVFLREVDEDNFDAVVALDVSEEQQTYVGSNMKSLAQSKVYSYLVPKAIYSDDELVGFTLYGREPKKESYWIFRLMIDTAHQGKGYGRAAVLKLIDVIGQMPGCSEIFLSFVPENDSAERLYRSVGFEPTGESDETGEVIMRFDTTAKTI